jgi:hypothetical protein
MLDRLTTRGAAMNRFGAVAGSVAVAVLVGCGGPQRAGQPGPPQTFALNPLTAREVVDAMARGGLDLPHPRDVGVQDCPRLGCLDKVDTDTASVLKFPTTGTAQQFAAGTRGAFQVEDMVLLFGPGVPAGTRPRFEAALRDAIQ